MDRLQAYSILGLNQNAGEEEVKAAYRALAQKYNVENFADGHEQEEAVRKMEEINQAFDVLMSYLRAGGKSAAYPESSGTSTNGRYSAIRQLINSGRVDEALAELSAIQNGSADAEWNFLMGSAYYYKGWLDQAIFYFREAVRLEPGNREYDAALRNLTNSSNGNMEGNPYTNLDPGAAAVNCACNTCALMCCMDACCGGCRGM